MSPTMKAQGVHFAGIDPSSKKVAVVGVDGNRRLPQGETYMLRRDDGPYVPAVAHRAGDAMRNTPLVGRASLVGVELPIVGVGGVKSTLVQAYVHGAIHDSLTERGCIIVLIQNTEWKKELCQNGQASKEEVESVIAEVWPEAHRCAGGDQDLLDAAGICYVIRERYKRGELL